jgi:nitrite reductase/ring-hydroxylating ferredoxin subunit
MTTEQVIRIPVGSPDGRTAWTIEHDGQRYAVFVHGGELIVTDARCPHKGGPLAEGHVRDGAVVCPWHWYTFDLATGDCRSTGIHRLRRYPVSITDGVAVVEVPVAVRRSWPEILRAHARECGTG